MSSVTAFNRLPQLRMIPVSGTRCFGMNADYQTAGFRVTTVGRFQLWGLQPEGETPVRELNRRFKDHRGVPVRVIRWEPETQRVIYLRDGYPHECFFSPRSISGKNSGR